ncbi:MAG: DUF6090 family protein [Bacteroidota bacterium]
MARIFRRLRKTVLEKGRLATYLFYILGEISLVVVGILMAIQINKWQEVQQDKADEQQLLKSLKREFDSNFKRLEDLLILKKDQENQGRNFIELITQAKELNKEEPVNSFPNTFSGEWGATFPNLNGSLSNGEINLIRNDSLKVLLLDWPARFELYKQAEERVVNSNDALNDYLGNFVPMSIVKEGDASKVDWPGSFFPNQQEDQLLELFPKLIQDLKFQNQVKEMTNRLYIQQRAGQNLLKRYRRIKALIDLELNFNSV